MKNTLYGILVVLLSACNLESNIPQSGTGSSASSSSSSSSSTSSSSSGYVQSGFVSSEPLDKEPENCEINGFFGCTYMITFNNGNEWDGVGYLNEPKINRVIKGIDVGSPEGSVKLVLTGGYSLDHLGGQTTLERDIYAVSGDIIDIGDNPDSPESNRYLRVGDSEYVIPLSGEITVDVQVSLGSLYINKSGGEEEVEILANDIRLESPPYNKFIFQAFGVPIDDGVLNIKVKINTEYLGVSSIIIGD